MTPVPNDLMRNTMLSKIITLWGYFLLKLKLNKLDKTKITIDDILVFVDGLLKFDFQSYSPKTAKTIRFTTSLTNVTEQLSRIAFIENILAQKEYLDSPLISNPLPLVEISVEEFLLTRKKYPVHPDEYLNSLKRHSTAIKDNLKKYENDKTYLEYYSRKTEWVLRDVYSTMEALLIVVKKS